MTGRPLPTFDRRRFLDWFLGTSFGALVLWVLYPVSRFLTTPRVAESTAVQVEAGTTSDPAFQDPGYKIVRFGQDPVIVFRVGENDFHALSATCTHLACIVEYQRDKHRIFCNCHSGVYDLSGQVVSGPPPHPLQPYRIDLVAKGSGQPRGVVVSKA